MKRVKSSSGGQAEDRNMQVVMRQGSSRHHLLSTQMSTLSSVQTALLGPRPPRPSPSSSASCSLLPFPWGSQQGGGSGHPIQQIETQGAPRDSSQIIPETCLR